MLSYGFWQRQFGGDGDVLTRTVMLEGRSFPVPGVMPPSFFGVEVGYRFDVAIPLCADARLSDDGKGRAASRRHWWISAMGRLRPGATIERANAESSGVLAGIYAGTLPETRPDAARKYAGGQLEVTPGLLATTGLVLPIACAN